MKKLEVSVEEVLKFGELSRKASFMSQLTAAQMNRILEFVMLYEFRRGEKVCSQGDPGDAFYVVRSGRFSALVKKGFFSSARKVGELGPGDFFGEAALIQRSPRGATIVAEEDSTAFVLLEQHFTEVARANPEFMAYLKNLQAARKFEADHNK